MPFAALSRTQLDAIFDGQGHDPCPGVELTAVELAPASGGTPPVIGRLWRPAGARSAAPGLLAFHGGGFTNGDPLGCGALAKVLALAAGVATLAPSYRLGTSTAPTWPGVLDDVVTAWRWLQAHAADIGVDPRRIAVAGESAGCLFAGHLATRSPHVAAGLAGLPGPAAMIAQWGPLDFVARWFDNGENPGAEVNLFGPGGLPAHAALYHQASVLAWAGGQLPPALFAYGRRDRIVHARQGQLGDAAWRRSGAHSELLVLDDIGHGVTGDNRERRRELLQRIAGFACARWANP